jgi:hypothetical protein
MTNSDDRSSDHRADDTIRSLILFIAGMGAGGFLTALLFAFAVTGHFIL